MSTNRALWAIMRLQQWWIVHTRCRHSGCCTACAGKGGGAYGPCWDCQATGHLHRQPVRLRDLLVTRLVFLALVGIGFLLLATVGPRYGLGAYSSTAA